MLLNLRAATPGKPVLSQRPRGQDSFPGNAAQLELSGRRSLHQRSQTMKAFYSAGHLGSGLSQGVLHRSPLDPERPRQNTWRDPLHFLCRAHSYLDKLGFNKALEPSLLAELTPRRVKVSFPDIRVEIDDRRALGDKNLKLFAYGTIDFRDCDAVTPDDAAPNDKDPPRFTLAKISYAPEGELITGGEQSPDYTKFGTTLAVKRGKKARVELDVRLQLRPYNYAGIDEKSNLAAYGSIRPATWKFEPQSMRRCLTSKQSISRGMPCPTDCTSPFTGRTFPGRRDATLLPVQECARA